MKNGYAERSCEGAVRRVPGGEEYPAMLSSASKFGSPADGRGGGREGGEPGRGKGRRGKRGM